MEIITKDNKKIDVSEDRVLTIPEGLLGFEEYTKYAIYEGAIIVCEGADNPAVRLRIVNAVSDLTGL